jgi:hypothetical protein
MTKQDACILVSSHAESPLKSLKLPFKEVCNLTSNLIPEGFDHYVDSITNLGSPNAAWSELATLVEGKKIFGNATYVGLQHYRRFFALEISPPGIHSIKVSMVDRNLYAQRQAENLSSYFGKVVIPTPELYEISLLENFRRFHLELFFGLEIACDEFDKLVFSRFGEIDSLDLLDQTNQIRPYNMFLGPREFYDQWLKILEPILKVLDSNRDKFPTEGYQSRWAGFIIERVFSIYLDLIINEGDWEIVERPIYFFENGLDYLEKNTALTQELSKLGLENTALTQELSKLEESKNSLERSRALRFARFLRTLSYFPKDIKR